jgi:serine/threonine protein kinase
MSFHYADTLKEHNWIGGGLNAYLPRHPNHCCENCASRPNPRRKGTRASFPQGDHISQTSRECRDRCAHILECFLMPPDHLFLSYCPHKAIAPRFYKRQERNTGPNGFHGRLIRVKEYEDPGLIARWIQQLTCALAYVERMGFCYNDLHESNCLLDGNFRLWSCHHHWTATWGCLASTSQTNTGWSVERHVRALFR